MISINPKYRDLIPALSIEEYSQLEKNIIRDGCLDPIVVFNSYIIDGHNRFEICTKNNISYKTREMFFEDEESAMDWMDKNQLGRRNLKPDDRALLLGRVYNRLKKSVGGDRKSEESKAQNEPLISTADKVGQEHGVSPATVKRAGKLAETFENIKNELIVTPESLPEIVDQPIFDKEEIIKEGEL